MLFVCNMKSSGIERVNHAFSVTISMHNGEEIFLYYVVAFDIVCL